MPWTFEGKLRTLENKTLRYKGHWQEMIAYRQLGLFDENIIEFKSSKFSSRDFYHFLLEPKLTTNDIHDICLMRVDAFGQINGRRKGFRYEVTDKYDEETGFMAMEKWTGWHASIVMQQSLKDAYSWHILALHNKIGMFGPVDMHVRQPDSLQVTGQSENRFSRRDFVLPTSRTIGEI